MNLNPASGPDEADDDDAGAMWRAIHAERQEKRAENREQSRALLDAAKVPYESRNDGAHLIVAGRWDFWPGTGLWHDRRQSGKPRSRGVRNLLAAISRATGASNV